MKMVPKRALPALSILALLSACGSGLGNSPEAADAYLAKHDYVSARLVLQNLIDASPKDFGLYLKLAQAEIAMGRGDEALTAAKRAEAAGAPVGVTLTLQAHAQILANRPLQALDLLARKQARQQAITPVLVARANALLGKQTEALDALEVALGSNPLNADYLAELARIHLASGNIAKARDYAQRALKAGPKSLEAMIASGEVALADGKATEALGLFDRAQSAFPKSVQVMLGRAAALGEVGRTGDMEAQIRTIEATAPGQLLTQLLKAQLAARKGKWDQVGPILEPVKAALNDQPMLDRLTGEAALRSGKFEEANASLSRYLTRHSGDLDARLMLAKAQSRIGEKGAAEQSAALVFASPSASPVQLKNAAAYLEVGKRANLIAAIRMRPQFLAEQIIAGDKAMNDGRWTESRDIFAALSEATGKKDPRILNNHGWSLFMLGEHKAALEQLALAHRNAPKNADIADSYGWVLIQSGTDKAKGIRLLEGAAAAKPGDSAIQKHLAAAKATAS